MKVFIKKSFAVLLIFILSLLLSNCSSTGPVLFDEHDITEVLENKGTETYSPSSENENKEEPNTTLPIKSSPTQNKEQEPVTNGVLEVHYIDVGQGDSILIHLSGKTMLIDAGNNAASIITYIKTLNIDKIDAIVATHPHADHIGGMAEIINEFVVDKIYMPKVAHTSKTYENLLLTIKNKNLKVNTAKAGTTIDLGNKIKIEVMAPNSENYNNLNDYSAVVKIEYENVSFLFTGDAEAVSEKEMVEKYGNKLKANVLKVGHHGSTTSTTLNFLNTVSPEYAIISVGENNSYGHPNQETLDKLKNIDVFRTDKLGTIVAKTDGQTINFAFEKTFTEEITPVPTEPVPTESIPEEPTPEKTEPIPEESTPEKTEPILEEPTPEKSENTQKKEDGIYIGNKNSKIFHKETCNSLPLPKNQVIFSSREEAINAGYRACKKCNP